MQPLDLLGNVFMDARLWQLVAGYGNRVFLHPNPTLKL